MSPKLRTFFSLRNRRVGREVKRRSSVFTCDADSINSFPDPIKSDKTKKNENGMRVPPSNLHIIRERDHTGLEIKPADSDRDTGGTKLAELVLSLLKNKRQVDGYSTVGTDEKEDEFSEIKIDNLREITNGNQGAKTANPINNESNSNVSAKVRSPDQHLFRRKSGDFRQTNPIDPPPLLTPPRIVLTHEVDRSSSR